MAGKFGFGIRIFSTISVPNVYSGRNTSYIIAMKEHIDQIE